LAEADSKVDALESEFFSCLSSSEQDALRNLSATLVAHFRRAP
jgi:hypothetical protein